MPDATTTETPLATASLTIPAPTSDAPLTTNRERTLNRYERAKIVKEWRTAAWVWAIHHHVPAFEWATIEVEIHQARGVLADIGSHWPTVKAVVDGLVDAKVLPNDTPKHLRGYAQHPPQRAKANAVVIHLTGELKEAK